MKQKLLFVFFCIAFAGVKAQTVSDFENLVSGIDSTRNGMNHPLGSQFTDGNAHFPNYYDTAFGGFWSQGWAITNVFDTVTPDFNNLYGNKVGGGNNQSQAYAVGKNNAVINIQTAARNMPISGFYITNTTYAYEVIENGNQFAKAFGGESGDDEDYFRLIIKPYKNGSLQTEDSVTFYLADYRFSDNTEDYIVKDWEIVDVSGFGPVDSLLFYMQSTDVGQFGINTPLFFALDDFTSQASPSSINNYALTDWRAFPNPTNNFVQLKGTNLPLEMELLNIQGQVIRSVSTKERIDLSDLKAGMYFLRHANASLLIQKR